MGGGLGRHAGKRSSSERTRGRRDKYDDMWDEGRRRRRESPLRRRSRERRSRSRRDGRRDKYDELWEEGKRRRGE